MGRDIDYALMLQVLFSKGYSLADISRKTGTAVSTLSCVKQESKAVPANWHEGWEGIVMQEYYQKAIGEAPPRVGDYIELEEYAYED